MIRLPRCWSWAMSMVAMVSVAVVAVSTTAGAGPTAGVRPQTTPTVAAAPTVPAAVSTTVPTTPTTVAEPTTTTTTTTAEPTTTTTVAVPVTAPAPATAPTAPPPTTDLGPDPGPGDAAARARAAIDAYVPAAHRAGIGLRVEAVPGETSWAWASHLIQIGEGQADDSWQHIAFIAAHEYGHLVAFEYGSGDYHGAPPTGFPATGDAAEIWSDCYAAAVTGFTWTMQCTDQQLAWARSWSFGPGASTGP